MCGVAWCGEASLKTRARKQQHEEGNLCKRQISVEATQTQHCKNKGFISIPSDSPSENEVLLSCHENPKVSMSCILGPIKPESCKMI